MKTFTIPRTLAVLPLAAMIAMTGCATIDNATQSMGHAVGIKNENVSAAASGGAIGCGAGALASRYLLHSSALAGCSFGGVAGAVTAVEIHKHQVAQARKLADEAKAAGATANVKTQTVRVVDNNGKVTDDEKLDSMTIHFDATDVHARGSASAQLLAKTARLADASTDPVTINVRGPKTERTWMNTQVTGALKADTKATVTEAYDAAPELVLAPVPNVSK